MPVHQSRVHNELKIDLDEAETPLVQTRLGGHGTPLAPRTPVQRKKQKTERVSHFTAYFPPLPQQQNGDILLCHCAATHSSVGLLTN